jgi:hypothetical protein
MALRTLKCIPLQIECLIIDRDASLANAQMRLSQIQKQEAFMRYLFDEWEVELEAFRGRVHD